MTDLPFVIGTEPQMYPSFEVQSLPKARGRARVRLCMTRISVRCAGDTWRRRIN